MYIQIKETPGERHMVFPHAPSRAWCRVCSSIGGSELFLLFLSSRVAHAGMATSSYKQPPSSAARIAHTTFLVYGWQSFACFNLETFIHIYVAYIIFIFLLSLGPPMSIDHIIYNVFIYCFKKYCVCSCMCWCIGRYTYGGKRTTSSVLGRKTITSINKVSITA